MLSVNAPGTVWFDLVSLFPPTYNNRPNGNRVDLMQKLADMKPGFLRFPGGNFLEGSTIADRFPWKTLAICRSGRAIRAAGGYPDWMVWGCSNFWNGRKISSRNQCTVYAGFSLPPKRELIKAGPDLAPYVADALDEIECHC